MKPARIVLRALWCDQGMAHLLELFNTLEDDFPSGLILIDFGAEIIARSAKRRVATAGPAVNTVVDALYRQWDAGRQPKLDYVLISHQDTDHWSMLTQLMDAVNFLGMPMKVGTIFRGGADWGPSATKTINRLKGFGVTGDAPVEDLDANLSHYSHANQDLGRLVAIDDFVLRILIANAADTSNTPSMRKNGTCAVVVIDYAGERMILPGDATWETLVACNELLGAWVESPVQPVKLISAPHHGALASMTPDSGKGNGSNLEQLEMFVGYVAPEAVITSAGYMNSFSHPHRIILEILGRSAEPRNTNRGPGPHPIVVYDLDTARWQRDAECKPNVYTTLLTLTAPVWVADYHFTHAPGLDEYFHTRLDAFEVPDNALVGVPTTSPLMVEIEMANATGETGAGIDKSTNGSSGNGHGANWPPSSAPIALPRLRSIFAQPAQRWMPPPRRVSPDLSSAAVL